MGRHVAGKLLGQNEARASGELGKVKKKKMLVSGQQVIEIIFLGLDCGGIWLLDVL